MAKYVIFLLACIICMANSYPNRGRYYEDERPEEFYELVPVRRDPRSIPEERVMVVPRRQIGPPAPRRPEAPEDLYAAQSAYEPIVAETGHSQSPYDYVDYGAYTGGYGAFGWYSDHPVYVQSGGSYR